MELISGEQFNLLIKTAGPLGAVIIVLGAMALWLFKVKGWTGFGDQSKMVAATRLDRIDSNLSDIKSRLSDVEIDLDRRPSREEFHQVEVTLARMDERLGNNGRINAATNAAVARIENYMIEQGSRKGS